MAHLWHIARPIGDIDVRQTAAGVRYDVRYRDPTGRQRKKSFRTKKEAERFVSTATAAIWAGQWLDPSAGRVTLADYAATWMGSRQLRPRTRELYASQLRLHIVPPLGGISIGRISPSEVRSWHAALVRRQPGGSLLPAKCYRLLRAILATAVEDELIARNPCQVKGAGTERTTERPIASPDQVWELSDTIEERYRILVLIAGFVGLRLGEALGLQRRDVDIERGILTVERQSQELEDGSFVFTVPKTPAGRRTLHVPLLVVDELVNHLGSWVGPEPEALLFTGVKGAPLRRNVWYGIWRNAVTSSSLPPEFHFHDLRHTGNTIAAATPGVSTKDLTYRLDHASGRAALLYQHATLKKDATIAGAVGEAVRRRPGVAPMPSAERPIKRAGRRRQPPEPRYQDFTETLDRTAEPR
jgi:integrase